MNNKEKMKKSNNEQSQVNRKMKAIEKVYQLRYLSAFRRNKKQIENVERRSKAKRNVSNKLLSGCNSNCAESSDVSGSISYSMTQFLCDASPITCKWTYIVL